jgi:hypothetical protein
MIDLFAICPAAPTAMFAAREPKAKARSNGPSGTRRSTNSLFARTGVSLVFALSTLAASFPSVWEDAIFWDDEKQRCVEYLPSLKISCVHRSLNSALLSA